MISVIVTSSRGAGRNMKKLVTNSIKVYK